MGILDKFKSLLGTAKQEIEMLNFKAPDGVVVAFFKHGRAFKLIPAPNGSYYENRELVYNADMIVSDGETHDLRDAKSILSIKVPKFNLYSQNAVSEELGTCGFLDYILRMKAGQYYNEGKCELCSACLWKSTELMFANNQCAWSAKDYLRLAFWHYELDMPDEAQRALEYLKRKGIDVNSYSLSDPFDALASQNINMIIQKSKEQGLDLVAFDDDGSGCCDHCAAMVGRVYSLSGNDARFPTLPDYVREHGNFHPGCRCWMYLYFDTGYIHHHGQRVDPVISSTRAYVDDRTDEECERYEYYLKVKEEKETELKERLERSILRGKNRKEYLYFKNNHPEIAPKTIDGYIKGKRTQSKKFQQLVKLAEANGFPIDTQI